MEDPIVEISDGKLRGITATNYKGERIYEFLGIPYGKPPIGELRFRAPQPVEPWNGIRDAIQNGNKCYHKDFLTNQIHGSEDCLYLNVCSKNIDSGQVLKPVLVFIHGGAFVMGSGDTTELSPTFLMCEDLVYVSVNYRLGVLGFLSLSDPSLDVPGNAGMKDQVLALKWVKQNIKEFGGDPNNVTIFGDSAGSASVNLHILSPSSSGLFHKAVMSSGSAISFWVHISPNALNIMTYLKNNCETESEILEVLRNTSVHDLIEAQSKIHEDSGDPKYYSFAPCVEKPNKTAFLIRNAIDIITSGDYNKVPMIIGYSYNEGLLLSSPGSDMMNLDIGIFLKSHVLVDNDQETIDRFSRRLKEMYKLEYNEKNKFLMFGHAVFSSTIIGLAKNFIRTCPEAIYFYVFNLVGSRNFLRKALHVDKQYPDACHGDILGYIFDIPELYDAPALPGSTEDIAIQRWLKFLSNFTKYGNPTPGGDDLNFKWEPMSTKSFQYLYFDKELRINTNPEEEKMALWREIYQANTETRDLLPE